MVPASWSRTQFQFCPNYGTRTNTITSGGIIMKTKAIFYHAGCPVCVAAEQSVANALDPAKYTVEHVHLGTSKTRIKEAEAAGVKSVPALVMNGAAFHINFGAGIDALK